MESNAEISDGFKAAFPTTIVSPSGKRSAIAAEGTTDTTENNQPKKARVLKRNDVISWDDYFMAISYLSAMRSKDPSTQVGACIVNPDKRIIGIGYNGFPRGCSDDELPWSRLAENELDTKYPVTDSFPGYITWDCCITNYCSGCLFCTLLCVCVFLQYVCHAEVNAILNKNDSSVQGCTVRPPPLLYIFQQTQIRLRSIY
jgi:deoxycytidylate deaminase